MAELRTRPKTIAGFRTRVVTVDGAAAQPDAPPRARFLFLHGFSDTADTWQRVQRRLGDAGFASLAVDQPSHGEADNLDPDRGVIEQYVEFGAAACRLAAGTGDDGEAAGAGAPLIVVGNSLGGAHSLLLAQHHPELVAGVGVISPASFDHPRWFGMLDSDRMQSRAESGKEIVPSRRLRRRLFGPAVRVVAFGRPWLAPSGMIDDWRTRMRDRDHRLELRNLSLRINDEYIHGEPIDLRQIRQPVLALWGTRDRLTLISSRARFEEEVADLEFHAYDNVGHMAQIEVPGRTTKHLRAFAERVTTPVG